MRDPAVIPVAMGGANTNTRAVHCDPEEYRRHQDVGPPASEPGASVGTSYRTRRDGSNNVSSARLSGKTVTLEVSPQQQRLGSSEYSVRIKVDEVP